MAGVRGGKSGHLNKPLALQALDGARGIHAGGQSAQRRGLGAHLGEQLALARRQFVREARPLGTKRQQHKAPLHGVAALHIGQVGLQHGQGLRVARRQQRHGHDALGPHLELAVGGQRHLAVAAQADGAHIDGAHHGAPAADLGAFQVDPGQPVYQRAHVGRGAAHVRQDEVVQPAEPARTHQAGGRAREHGFDGPLGHAVRQRQRAVALDDHQRAGDVQSRHGRLHRLDQVRNARDQACV